MKNTNSESRSPLSGLTRIATVFVVAMVNILAWSSTVRASPLLTSAMALEDISGVLPDAVTSRPVSSDNPDQSGSLLPDGDQYSAATNLVLGVLNAELSPAQFDQMASSLHPVLLHVCLYYVRAYEINRGVNEFSKSLLAAYFRRSNVDGVIFRGLRSPAVLLNASVVSFHAEFPATHSGVKAITEQDLMGLFLKPFSSES